MGLQAVATKFATGTYTVTRRALPTFVKGIAVPGASYTFLMAASIQPVTGRELEDVPRGQQSNDVKVVYTETELRGLTPRVAAGLAIIADSGMGIFTSTAHGKATGDGPFQVKGTSLPDGIEASTNYWVIKLDADTFALATSYVDALDEDAIPFTSDGADLTLVIAGNMVDVVTYKGEPWEVTKCEHWEAFGGNHWRAYITRNVKP